MRGQVARDQATIATFSRDLLMVYATCSASFGDSSHICSGNVQPYRIAERASFEQLCKVAFECFAAISARARDQDHGRLAIGSNLKSAGMKIAKTFLEWSRGRSWRVD